jgi:hypothetical protein
LKGLKRKERRGMERSWRKGRRRNLLSPSAVFRYMEAFHDPGQEKGREDGKGMGGGVFCSE